MKMFSRTLMVALTLTMSLGFTTPAFAQDDVSDGDVVAAFTTTSTTWSAVITVPVGLTVLLVVLLTRSSSELETYIQENNVALQHDLHMGGGQTTAELASFFNVPADQHAEFAQMLTGVRADLIPLTDINTLSSERAGEFAWVIYESMMERPTLAQHLPRLAG
ncbi:hypothetical protein DL240_13505 [Lujinxingia litoralis]|uniref:DUF3015 domain-containing protein n=1 Tax=Lujinxingia litoralis TaxID=2211119 RepID=A0A328C7N4_9DELT|nr:hypothetical protein [Lujinxingia litoralis]RAL21145.1 hypothetical protein DL240_13505 [Lujinxingia litoralis]